MAFLRHEKGKFGHSLWIADTVKQLTLQQLSAFCLSPSPPPPPSPAPPPTYLSHAGLWVQILYLTFALLANRLLAYLQKKLHKCRSMGKDSIYLTDRRPAILANRLLSYLANCKTNLHWCTSYSQ